MRLAALCVLLATSALAKPWHGIEPGVARRDDVVKKFGPPGKTVQKGSKDLLVYLGKTAIINTVQAQFRVDPKTGLVERIDVFPGPKIDVPALEDSYGPPCPNGKPILETCYIKRVGPDMRTYFHYLSLGLVVAFKTDGTVHSLIFTASDGKKSAP